MWDKSEERIPNGKRKTERLGNLTEEFLRQVRESFGKEIKETALPMIFLIRGFSRGV